MALCRPVKEDRRALDLVPRLSPPGDRWCDVVDRVPAGNVSSSSTLQVFILVRVAVPASVSARSFSFTPVRPGQYTENI